VIKTQSRRKPKKKKETSHTAPIHATLTQTSRGRSEQEESSKKRDHQKEAKYPPTPTKY